MTHPEPAARLRRTMLALVSLSAAGTLAELLLSGHTDGVQQAIPLVVGAAAVVAPLAALRRPGPATAAAVRATGVALALAGLVGIGLHGRGNWGFARETQPGATTGALVGAALTEGNPLLAPGVLLLLGALAWLGVDGPRRGDT